LSARQLLHAGECCHCRAFDEISFIQIVSFQKWERSIKSSLSFSEYGLVVNVPPTPQRFLPTLHFQFSKQEIGLKNLSSQ
jgi:hypothetical protein